MYINFVAYLKVDKNEYLIFLSLVLIFILKVVPGGCHRYFFGARVKTVKLIGGTRFLAARSGLNVRTYSKKIFRLLLCLQSSAG